MNTCRYCNTEITGESIATDNGSYSCRECNYCCDCGNVQATDWSRDPLCAACLAARQERDDAAMEWAAERDAEDRYYREGRYAQ